MPERFIDEPSPDEKGIMYKIIEETVSYFEMNRSEPLSHWNDEYTVRDAVKEVISDFSREKEYARKVFDKYDERIMNEIVESFNRSLKKESVLREIIRKEVIRLLES